MNLTRHKMIETCHRETGVAGERKDFLDDGFDVDDFIRRMTLATGLDVKEVQSAGTDNCRLSIQPKTTAASAKGEG